MTLSLSEYFHAIPEGPLNGTLIVSYGSQICGSWASEQLVRMGACVIKYEKHGGGDPKRSNSPPTSFNQFNAGKLSVQSDKSPEDEDTRLRLMNMAHVIIDNRSVGAKKRDQLLQNSLVYEGRDRPLIYCGLSGYGQHDARKAYDRSVQAASGMADHNEGLVSFPVIDMSTGTEAAKVILSELLRIEKLSHTQRKAAGPVKIEISMLDTALTMMSNMIAIQHDTGISHSTIVPFGLFKTQTNQIGLAVARDEQFKKLCETLELERLYAQFPTHHLRLGNKEEVEKAIQEKLMTNGAHHWQDVFQKADIPAEPVEKFADVVKKRAESIFMTDTAGGHYVTCPSHIAYCGGTVQRNALLPAPSLGEHNNLVTEFVRDYSDTPQLAETLAEKITETHQPSI